MAARRAKGSLMVAEASLVSRLAAMPVVHRSIRALKLTGLAAAVLERHPIQRRTRSGLRYRVRFLESLLVADEIWKREVYRAAFEGHDVRAFVDIGTNVGYFPCYAAEHVGRDVVGLAVDANPAVIDEARWHLGENGLRQVRVLHGIVGHPTSVKEAELYVAGSNVSASAQPSFNPHYALKADVETRRVPTVDVLAEWRKHAGDRRVDLLKMDIEGFEEVAIDNLGELLAITDAVVIEWHNWMTSRARISERLSAHGFRLSKLVSEDEDAGIGVFRRD